MEDIAERRAMTPKDQVKEGYNVVSHLYRADNAEDGEYGSWLDELARHLTPESAVLDLGCGCGIPVARWLRQNGFAVTGIDLSPVQIERARYLVPDATFLCGDITTVEQPRHSFDAVVAFYAIIHVPLDEQQDLLHSIHRWLRPGGWFLATVGSRSWTGTEEDWLGGGMPMYWSHEDTNTYLRWLRDAGFILAWHRFIPEGSSGHTLLLART